MGHKRKVEDNKRLKKTHSETKTFFGRGVWFDDDKNRYVKCTPSNTPGYTKYLRKLSNRRVRKAKDKLNNSSYKKIYDYWWELF